MMTIAHAVGSPVSKCRARKNRDGKRVRERERERGAGEGEGREMQSPVSQVNYLYLDISSRSARSFPFRNENRRAAIVTL